MASEDPETRPEAVEHGVDVEDHREFIEWVAENPEDAMVEFRAMGVAEDVANRTTATIGANRNTSSTSVSHPNWRRRWPSPTRQTDTRPSRAHSPR